VACMGGSMAPMTWVLSDADVELVDRIGRARQRAKEARRIRDRKVDTRDGAELHQLGFAAEVAVARYFGAEPDTRIGGKGHKGQAVKVVAADGRGVVFGTHYNPRAWGYDLRVFPGKLPDVQYLVLITGQIPWLELHGAITPADFMRYKRMVELPPYGYRWLCGPEHLTPLDVIRGRLGLSGVQGVGQLTMALA
jgi:hypothetical protein